MRIVVNLCLSICFFLSITNSYAMNCEGIAPPAAKLKCNRIEEFSCIADHPSVVVEDPTNPNTAMYWAASGDSDFVYEFRTGTTIHYQHHDCLDCFTIISQHSNGGLKRLTTYRDASGNLRGNFAVGLDIDGPWYLGFNDGYCLYNP